MVEQQPIASVACSARSGTRRAGTCCEASPGASARWASGAPASHVAGRRVQARAGTRAGRVAAPNRSRTHARLPDQAACSCRCARVAPLLRAFLERAPGCARGHPRAAGSRLVGRLAETTRFARPPHDRLRRRRGSSDRPSRARSGCVSESPWSRGRSAARAVQGRLLHRHRGVRRLSDLVAEDAPLAGASCRGARGRMLLRADDGHPAPAVQPDRHHVDGTRPVGTHAVRDGVGVRRQAVRAFGAAAGSPGGSGTWRSGSCAGDRDQRASCRWVRRAAYRSAVESALAQSRDSAAARRHGLRILSPLVDLDQIVESYADESDTGAARGAASRCTPGSPETISRTG